MKALLAVSMNSIKILSWNVLHQAHERRYNPESRILRAHEDNSERLQSIVEVLKQHVCRLTVACLQECSGELLSLVNTTFSGTHDLLSQRVPESLDEYLITLTPKFMKCSLDARRSVPRGANGYMSVSNDTVRFVNCHLRPQFTVRGENVLGIIADEDQTSDQVVIVAGDFNETAKKVKKALDSKYRVPYFGLSYKKKKGLDYIIFNRVMRFKAGMIETELLSDHDPVVLEFLA